MNSMKFLEMMVIRNRYVMTRFDNVFTYRIISSISLKSQNKSKSPEISNIIKVNMARLFSLRISIVHYFLIHLINITPYICNSLFASSFFNISSNRLLQDCTTYQN